jgi:predicted HAD superfamily Cof-like phosphohydrolase
MKQIIFDIAAFHKKFDLEYNGPPRQLPEDLFAFREGFMQEELDEFSKAYMEGDIEKQFDALVDLIYVAAGTAYLMGGNVDISAAHRDQYQPLFYTMWNLVHSANMKKIRAQSEDESKRGSTFDVVKPEGWEPPTFEAILATATERTNG